MQIKASSCEAKGKPNKMLLDTGKKDATFCHCWNMTKMYSTFIRCQDTRRGEGK
jgi:hypothetical protein